jgi:hypothetical protein
VDENWNAGCSKYNEIEMAGVSYLKVKRASLYQILTIECHFTALSEWNSTASHNFHFHSNQNVNLENFHQFRDISHGYKVDVRQHVNQFSEIFHRQRVKDRLLEKQNMWQSITKNAELNIRNDTEKNMFVWSTNRLVPSFWKNKKNTITTTTQHEQVFQWIETGVPNVCRHVFKTTSLSYVQWASML